MKASDHPGGTSHAHPSHHHWGPQRRIDNELKRIQEGVAKGYLSASQAGTLTTEVDDAETALKADKAGGAKLTGADRKALASDLNKASADIFEKKQTGRVSELEAEGKLTSSEASTIDAQVSTWAGGIADKGGLLGADWHALNAMIRTDERTNKATAGAAGSPAASSSTTSS